jgi:hypothetical protein
LKWIAATPRNSENTIPTRTLVSTIRMNKTIPGVDAGINFIARAPPSAPITIIPSRPILITPLCSEKQPPRATRARTDAKINVY